MCANAMAGELGVYLLRRSYPGARPVTRLVLQYSARVRYSNKGTNPLTPATDDCRFKHAFWVGDQRVLCHQDLFELV